MMLRGDGAGLHTPEGSDARPTRAHVPRPSADFAKRSSPTRTAVGRGNVPRARALRRPADQGRRRRGRSGWRVGSPGKDDDCSKAGIDKVADQLK